MFLPPPLLPFRFPSLTNDAIPFFSPLFVLSSGPLNASSIHRMVGTNSLLFSDEDRTASFFSPCLLFEIQPSPRTNDRPTSFFTPFSRATAFSFSFFNPRLSAVPPFFERFFFFFPSPDFVFVGHCVSLFPLVITFLLAGIAFGMRRFPSFFFRAYLLVPSPLRRGFFPSNSSSLRYGC